VVVEKNKSISRIGSGDLFNTGPTMTLQEIDESLDFSICLSTWTFRKTGFNHVIYT